MDVSFKDRGLEYGSLYNSMQNAVDRASELTVGHHKDIARSLRNIRIYTDKMFSALSHHQIKQAKHDVTVLDHEKLLIKRNHALMILLSSSGSLANSSDDLPSSMKALIKSSNKASEPTNSKASPAVSVASSKAQSIISSAGDKGMSMVASASSLTASMSSKMSSNMSSVSSAVATSQSAIQSLQSEGVSMSMSLAAMRSKVGSSSTKASVGAFSKIQPSSETASDSNFTSVSANHSSNSSEASNGSSDEGVPPKTPNDQKQSNMPDPFKSTNSGHSNKSNAQSRSTAQPKNAPQPPKTPNQPASHPGEETFHHHNMSIDNPNVDKVLADEVHDGNTPTDRRRAAGSQPQAPSGQSSDTDSKQSSGNTDSKSTDATAQNGGHLPLT